MAPRRLSTQFVHAGEHRKPLAGRPVATPIYATSAFTYDTMDEVESVFTGEGGDYIYTRHGNPTVAAFEDAMVTLEAGQAACAYASGMAALHAALFACELTPGSTVLASRDLYGATFSLLNHIFAPVGVKTLTADFNDLDEVRTITRAERPKALVGETISNPLLKVCDLAACAEIAHEGGARLIVDNTFASPYLAQPLTLGADFVVHSATKYLGGHGDAMGGVVVAREARDQPALLRVVRLVGGVLSAWEAHHILRGIKTLSLRLERSCKNAEALARRFQGDPRLSRVHYPALAADANSGLMARVLRPPFGGALLSIEIKDNTRAAAFRFMNALQLCVRLTSLGDVFTGVSHSASSSHRELKPEERKRLGITDGLVRISTGIEDVEDLIEDIDQALDKV